ncbi:alpha/beta fold hydrolase [Ekhidna sp.]|uniref:alpha/beta hydrolase n=1 Tax=Ekhidna sp. TaxID=2608089 RepID=UPI003297A650
MKALLTITLIAICSLTIAQDFTEKQVEIGGLKGTLSTPNKKTKTAILLIAGSGPTDRNGNSAMGFVNNSLKMVSENLASAGYAVLRYDKRGIAESKKAVENPATIRFDQFVDDARSWLNFLKNEGYKKLIIAGHSQGSLVGMLAAQNNENVKAFISISGLSENAGDAIVRQLGAQSEELAMDARINIDSMKAGYSVNKYSPYLISLFGPAIQPFLKSYMAYTPNDEIKKLSIPILLVNGSTDIQVGIDQAQSLKESYPDAELIILEGMNHILKDAPLDPGANMATYNNPDLPLSDGLMSGIISFIQKL